MPAANSATHPDPRYINCYFTAPHCEESCEETSLCECSFSAVTESPVIPAFLHCEKICPQVTICRKAKFLPFVTQTSLFSNFYLSLAWLQSTALFCPMNFCRHISAKMITCRLLIDLTIQENFYPDKEAEKCSCDLPCHTATVANRRHCWEKHPDLQSIYSSDPDKSICDLFSDFQPLLWEEELWQQERDPVGPRRLRQVRIFHSQNRNGWSSNFKT